MPNQSHSAFHKGTHRPMTTAHLAHTMMLLRLNTAELQQKIESELANNPALEMVEERRCPTCNRKLAAHSPCSYCIQAQNLSPDDPIVFVSQPEQNFTGSSHSKDAFYSDNEFSAETEDLPTYVLGQIAVDLSEKQRPIAAHILTSLDDDGLLIIPTTEIAIYFHISLTEVEEVIHVISRANPIGVGSTNSKQALIAQLDVLKDTVPFPKSTKIIIENAMKMLSRRQYAEISRTFNIPLSKVKKIAEFVVNNLNPFPGRSYWGNTRHHSIAAPSTYRNPDVIITKYDESPDSILVVEIMWPIRGVLRVNPLFKKAFRKAPEDKSSQWKEDIEQANLLVKCLGQRYHTLVRMMQRLAVQQRDFILGGDSQMKPLTRVHLADELGVHEATVSRAVSGKTAQLPNKKIIPISTFFDRSLHVRTALKNIINKENSPLSDTKIAVMLAEQGHSIARRTVAKYRSMEGILPAHLRNGVNR